MKSDSGDFYQYYFEMWIVLKFISNECFDAVSFYDLLRK